jgi:hypothetical protein
MRENRTRPRWPPSATVAALRDRDYPGNDSAPLDHSRGALFFTAFLTAGALDKRDDSSP